MQIPIIILNRDRLSTTEKLCDQLMLLSYSDIHIVDLGSTYPELLSWYELLSTSGQDDITIHYFNNIGHKGIWSNGFLKQFAEYQWVAVTDSDVTLNLNTPKNFLQEMVYIAKDFRVNKVGCAIEYLDITNPVLKSIIAPIESQYWLKKLPHHTLQVYSAPVDTTMCIIRPNDPFQYQAVRIGGEFIITHNDWYSDWNKLTVEEQYYFNHADPKIATTLQHYNKWKTLNH